MNKAEVRKIYLEKRFALSDAAYQQLNVQLYQQFFANIDLSFVHCLHIFLPMETKREPDTWPILDRVRREFPQVRISMPKVVDGHLENIYFEGMHQLKKNNWGIWEPQQGVPTPTEKIDVVIVPLLAFDLTGHRVGYGKGFYDRFLAMCRTDCQRIGISLFDPVEAIEDMNHDDIKLTHGLTPSQLLKFPLL